MSDDETFLQIGGSFAVNDLLSTVDAHVGAGSTLTAAGTIHVGASDGGTIAAIAGAVAVAENPVGIGASLAINTIAPTVSATLSGTATGPVVEVVATENAEHSS